MEIIIFFFAHWYLSLFTQSFFYHRYSAHRMFTMNKFWEKVFFLLSYIFQGSSYLSPKAYGIMHRVHHAYPDTEKDVHSPRHSKGLWDMMLKTKDIYNNYLHERIEIEERFKGNVPEWNFIDKLGDQWLSRIFFGLSYCAFYYYFDAQWWMYFTLLPIQFVMGPFHGAIINWFSHKFGYRNFKMYDTSTNLLPFDFLMWGESYHNNHHKRGNNPNFGGVRWHEIDPMYPIILFFNAIRIIRLKEVPADQR